MFAFGRPWAQPGAASGSDDSRAAFATVPFILDDFSDQLTGTRFPFTIPPGARIDGVTFAFERQTSSGLIFTMSCRLVVNGTPVGSDKGAFDFWPFVDEYISFGGPTDTWGLTLISSQINTAFGVYVQGINGEGFGDVGAVDDMLLTLHYTPADLPAFWTVEGDQIVESYGFETDVLRAHNLTEQRVRLSGRPEEAIRFRFMAGSARESEAASAFVFGTQDEAVAVPLWQYGSKTTGPITAGGTLIPFGDALLAPYRVGEWAVLWRDPFNCEIVKVGGVSGAGITANQFYVVNSWPTGTRVYPAPRARLASKTGLRWNSSRFLSGEVEFRMERR